VHRCLAPCPSVQTDRRQDTETPVHCVRQLRAFAISSGRPFLQCAILVLGAALPRAVGLGRPAAGRPSNRLIRGISDGLIFEIPLVLAIFLATSIFTWYTQQITTVNNGRGWDGVWYFRIAEQIVALERPSGIAPHIYRIGTPLLAALINPSEILLGFLIANVIARFLFIILLVISLRLHISNWVVRLLLVTMAVVNWVGPVRFIYFYPTISDPSALVLLLAGLICISKMRLNASTGLLQWAGAFW
jgi:hypothetical protein